MPHEYPSNYPPGRNWSTDIAWKILDTMPVGKLSVEERAYLGGLIAGALARAANEGPLDVRDYDVPAFQDLFPQAKPN